MPQKQTGSGLRRMAPALWLSWVGIPLAAVLASPYIQPSLVLAVPLLLLVLAAIAFWFVTLDSYEKALATLAPDVRERVGRLWGWNPLWLQDLILSTRTEQVRAHPELRERAARLHALTFGPLVMLAAVAAVLWTALALRGT
ncbi:MAG: hypothetical protein U1E29_06940 [Coriobacteriia bacterium]|nr:hypothetical protein [Coriobacteriia bacterium]